MSARTPKELDDDPLTGDDYRRFRTVLGKAMWLAQERVDIAFACKEVAREMGKPTQGSWEQLKRLVRYLRGTVDTQQVLRVQGVLRPEWLDVYSDSNWGSDSGKSTSCGIVAIAGFPLLCFSRTQAVVALSSCEAELFSLTTSLQEGIGLCSLLGEIGFRVRIRAYCDSSAALAVLETTVGTTRSREEDSNSAQN